MSENEFYWDISRIIKEGASSTDKIKRHWFRGGEYATANLVQLAKGERIALHIHEEHDEIIYFVHGSARFEIAGSSRIMKRGCLVIIPAGIVHGFQVVSSSLCILSIYAPFYGEDANADRILVNGG